MRGVLERRAEVLELARVAQRPHGLELREGRAALSDEVRMIRVRQPIGVAGLIVPANTPIANVAWKVFPALICGNTAVLKSAEDTPAISICR